MQQWCPDIRISVLQIISTLSYLQRIHFVLGSAGHSCVGGSASVRKWRLLWSNNRLLWLDPQARLFLVVKHNLLLFDI